MLESVNLLKIDGLNHLINLNYLSLFDNNI
jgi:hypothetical protein